MLKLHVEPSVSMSPGRNPGDCPQIVASIAESKRLKMRNDTMLAIRFVAVWNHVTIIVSPCSSKVSAAGWSSFRTFLYRGWSLCDFTIDHDMLILTGDFQTMFALLPLAQRNIWVAFSTKVQTSSCPMLR